jgi:hypothetical protein
MGRCEVCHNDYERAFTINLAGRTYTFDSFECAIHALAPRCEYCQCRIIGHGMESDGAFYCCAHCARQEGQRGLCDHAH